MRKECSSAQLNLYTAHSCRQYFGVSCSVIKNLNGCKTGQSFCMDYNHNQCISDGQINLNGVECFWNEDKSTCQERICANGPSNASSHQECANFLSTCQKGGCRIKGCFDYQYAIDASIFEGKRCVTNGIRCALRKECKDINIEDGCKFDINLNPCVWIDEKCYSKTCQTAQVALTKHEDCNSYLSYCTVKQGGGCTNKQNCKDYQIQEACFTDGENFECIWDVNLSKCFSNQCIHFCGDGIVTGQEEQCDDGNYFPYDGCYRCQVQCPQGCNKCILRMVAITIACGLNIINKQFTLITYKQKYQFMIQQNSLPLQQFQYFSTKNFEDTLFNHFMYFGMLHQIMANHYLQLFRLRFDNNLYISLFCLQFLI
ncbi:unnamed protein product [Paramecium octaurelia]|uniref:Uncharacterized protein n=1 Tax=Paramecium octaurelia TaxID=43137 RepID=A0A8S1U247_PAROT|nr:unnamed protein product [Paramecium octaurelia]